MKKRILAMFCCCVLLLGFVMPPERAHAVALVDDVVVAAAVFVAGCGLTWVVTHTDGEGFTAKVGSLLNDYLSAKFAGQSISDWIGDITFSARAGVLFFPKLAATKFGEFTRWLIDTKGITAGNTTDLGSTTTVQTADGQSFVCTIMGKNVGGYLYNDNQYGSVFDNISTSFDNPTILDFGANKVKFYLPSNRILQFSVFGSSGSWTDWMVADFPVGSQLYFCKLSKAVNYFYLGVLLPKPQLVVYLSAPIYTTFSSAGVAIGAKAIDVPDTAAIPDDQALGIDTGTNAADMAEVKTLVVDKAVAGELSATVTGATAIPGTVTDVDGLGLPSIATVITQKFPFSIPWDIARGIELLAAPPEAPRWSVDFMAPIAYRVGAWQGDTTVTLDMAEFPLVGQVCRWAFTIGFCLLLAAATKKLAWVA